MTASRRRLARAAVAAAASLLPATAVAADTASSIAAPGSPALTADQAPSPARESTTAAPSPQLTPGPSAPDTLVSLGAPPRQLIVPDLAAVIPAGATATQLAAIGKLDGVRATLAASGGQLDVNGHQAAVLGVSPQQFRGWTPPVTAANLAVWAALTAGRMVSSSQATIRLGLATGTAYPVRGAQATNVAFGTTALLGIPGIDLVVSQERSADLGLVPDAVLLISAPGTDQRVLMKQIRNVLGRAATVISLVQVVTPAGLPVDPAVPNGQPANYLQLFRDSAARYCPGLSWTILAAIGQIESGDGANNGPSPAGALGPMQFMPGTWAMWGTDGFGQTGKPDIMNPLDAVPSAARLLCAGGAAAGGAALSAAIYDYNHATWYVTEVLELASEYAREYH